MQRKYKIRNKVLFRIIGLIILICLLQACDNDSQFIKDMDAFFMMPERIDLKERDNVTEVVQRYFPQGMKLSDALKDLDEQGFEIYEYQKKGFRKWPNGELKPYKDKNHAKMGATPGIKVSYFAKKVYGSIYLLVTKHARITINSNDGEKIKYSYGQIVLLGM